MHVSAPLNAALEAHVGPWNRISYTTEVLNFPTRDHCLHSEESVDYGIR